MIELTALTRYPVKSMRRQELDAADVEPWGLAGDRRWMVVDDAGDVVTAREINGLVLVRPGITATGLRLEADGAAPLDVPWPDAGTQRPVQVWGSRLTAAPAGAEADAWLADVLGAAVHLVHLDDPRRRAPNPEFAPREDRVSLADGYPLLLATEESLAALDAAVHETDPDAPPLPMTRLRPNVVVAGAPAWAEDDWRRIRVGGPDGVTFRAVKGCPRCVLTTIDPETARRGKEPVRSLARIRRHDGQTWFGINLVPDLPADGGGPWPSIRVGDQLEVLDAVEPSGGPLR